MSRLDELVARDQNTLKVSVALRLDFAALARTMSEPQLHALMTGIAKVVAAQQFGERVL